MLKLAFRYVPARHKIIDLQPLLEKLVLSGRREFRLWSWEHMTDSVSFYRDSEYIRSQSILNNIFFGTLTSDSPKVEDRVNQCIVQLLIEEDLLEQVADIGMEFEVGTRGETGPTHMPVAWRDRKAILALCGSKCSCCGTVQYPPQKICLNPECRAIDQMEEHRLSERKGTLFSYTEDSLAFNIIPPQMYGIIDFEGGGRWPLDITDCEAGSLQVGMPMKISFRKKYADEAHGIYGYFWKAVPDQDCSETK